MIYDSWLVPSLSHTMQNFLPALQDLEKLDILFVLGIGLENPQRNSSDSSLELEHMSGSPLPPSPQSPLMVIFFYLWFSPPHRQILPLVLAFPQIPLDLFILLYTYECFICVCKCFLQVRVSSQGRLEASIGIPGTELATEVVSHWEPNLSLL